MVAGTSHHGWPVAEKAIREPASSTPPCSRSQRRGAPLTVPLTGTAAGVTLLAAVVSGSTAGLPPRRSVPVSPDTLGGTGRALATALHRFQEAQDCAGGDAGPLRLRVMPGLGHHDNLRVSAWVLMRSSPLAAC